MSEPQVQSAEPSAHASAIALVVGLLAVGGFVSVDGLGRDVIFVGAAAVAALASVRAWARPDGHRIGLALLGLGQAAFAIGDGLFAVAEHRSLELDVPSFADISYIAGYPLIGAGLTFLIRSRRGRTADRASALDASLAAMAAALLCWVLIIEESSTAMAVPLGQRLLAVMYPMGDLILTGLALRFAVRTRHEGGASWLLLGSVGALLVADVSYGSLLLTGTFSSGGASDLIWLLGYVLWTAAMLHPSITAPAVGRRDPGSLSSRRAAILAGALLIAPLVLLGHHERSRGEAYVVAAGAALIALLVSARVHLVVALLRRATIRSEAAERRERLLHETSVALAAAHRVEQVVATTTTALRTLLPAGARAVLAVGPPERMAVVRTLGPEAVSEGDLLRWDATDEELRPLKRSLSPPLPGTTVPLAVGGTIVGALHVSLLEPRDIAELRTLRTLAGDLALALDRAGSDLARRREAVQTSFRALVANTRDAVLVVDLAGRVRFASDAAVRLAGTDPTGSIVTALMADTDAETALRALLLRSVRRGPSRLRATWLAPDGPTDVIIAARPMLDDPVVPGVALTVSTREEDSVAAALLPVAGISAAAAVVIEVDPTTPTLPRHADAWVDAIREAVPDALAVGWLDPGAIVVLLDRGSADVLNRRAAIAHGTAETLAGAAVPAGMCVSAGGSTRVDAARLSIIADAARHLGATHAIPTLHVAGPTFPLDVASALADRHDVLRALVDDEHDLRLEPVQHLASGGVAGACASLVPRSERPARGIVDHVALATELGRRLSWDVSTARGLADAMSDWTARGIGQTGLELRLPVAAESLVSATWRSELDRLLSAGGVPVDLLVLVVDFPAAGDPVAEVRAVLRDWVHRGGRWHASDMWPQWAGDGAFDPSGVTVRAAVIAGATEALAPPGVTVVARDVVLSSSLDELAAAGVHEARGPAVLGSRPTEEVLLGATAATLGLGLNLRG